MISMYPTTNSSLAKLQTLKSDKWLEITTTQLPKTLRIQLSAFFNAITGTELPDDLTTLLVSFDRDAGGLYNRTYAPSIYQSPNGDLSVVWGNQYYSLTSDILNDLDAQVSIERLEKYDETCLVLSIDTGDEYLELPLQLRIHNDNREVKLADLKKLVKNIRAGKSDPSELASLLYVREVREKQDFAPTFALKDLEENTPYVIKSAELKEFPTHSNYVLTITNPQGEELKCWSPGLIRDSLDAGATIADDNSTFFTFFTREGKKRTQYFVDVEGLVFPENEETISI